MSDTLHATSWLPSDWLDESIPEVLRHPNDFIHQCEDGSFVITEKIGKDDLQPDGDEETRENYTIRVATGDVVKFSPTEWYGTFNLHVRDDLSFWIDGDYPSKANCFHEPDTEAFASSLDEMLQVGGADGNPMQAGIYTVQVYWWGESLAYRFDIDQTGTPAFHEVH